jgi:hypothetical protein
MQFAVLTACLTVCAMPLAAQEVLSAVTGNWGGSDNDGFYFRAELTQMPPEQGTARLRIWNAPDGVPPGGDAQFDNDRIMLSAYAIDNGQRLELLVSPEETILQVITEYADEEYEGRIVVDIQYLDNQFTVIRYDQQDTRYSDSVSYACNADLWNGTVTVNGVTSDVPRRDFGALNASGWAYDAAFERDICPRPDCEGGGAGSLALERREEDPWRTTMKRSGARPMPHSRRRARRRARR